MILMDNDKLILLFEDSIQKVDNLWLLAHSFSKPSGTGNTGKHTALTK